MSESKDTLNDLTKRIADAIDQKFHDMGFEADPRNDALWHRGVTIELAKAAVAEVKRCEIPLIDEADEATTGRLIQILEMARLFVIKFPQDMYAAPMLAELQEAKIIAIGLLKRESGERAKTRDLVNMIRMKLERRFQVADYMPDSYAEPHSCRGLVSDMCQDFMAHVREIHALAERALTSIEDGSADADRRS